MSRLLGLGAAIALASASPGMTAEISHSKISNLDVIFITGDIGAGDADKFRRLSVAYDRAVVALDSTEG